MTRVFDLVPVKGLAAAIGFHHGHFAQLHAFERGEARATAFALATPADRGVVLGRTAVLYLAVFMGTEGAAHYCFSGSFSCSRGDRQQCPRR